MIEESDTWSEFYDVNQGLIQSLGHILHTTKISYNENWRFKECDQNLKALINGKSLRPLETHEKS